MPTLTTPEPSATDRDAAPDWDLDDETLRACGNVKWTYPGPGVLPAWVAEMDVATAPVVRQALLDAVRRNVTGYPPPDHLTGLGEATASLLRRRFGISVEPRAVIACGDVMAGIRVVLETLCDQAPVVVPIPAYPPFLEIPAVTGRRLLTVPTAIAPGPAGPRAVLDLDAIEGALAAGGRTVLLSAPHNPLGRAFTRTELEALRDVVLRRGARVISDEIHAPMVLPGAEHVPYSAIEGTADHVTTLTAASKAWNLPGLKCAQIIANNGADLAALRAVPTVANHGTSSLGLVATVAAYTHGEPWLDAVLAHLDAQRSRFGVLLAEQVPTVRWTPMEATYLAWVDARGTGLDDPSHEALETGRVMVHPGSWFGDGLKGFARVNLATSSERLERIVAGLAKAWA